MIRKYKVRIEYGKNFLNTSRWPKIDRICEQWIWNITDIIQKFKSIFIGLIYIM